MAVWEKKGLRNSVHVVLIVFPPARMYFKKYRFLMDLVWGMYSSLGLKDEKREAVDPNSKAPFLPP